MPIPSKPKVSSYDHFDDDGNFVDEYTMVHVPCPSTHVGKHALNAAQSKFDTVYGSYDQDDGGHVSVALKNASDSDAAIKTIEEERDRVRRENDLQPYEPGASEQDMSSIGQRVHTEDKNGGPRYIH